MRYELFIGLRYLLSRRRDRSISIITWISICGIALGGMSLIVSTSVMNGFRDNMQKAIIGALPHIRIFGWEEGIRNIDELDLKVRSHPRVTATAPYIFKEALLVGNNTNGALIRAIDPQRDGDVTEIKSFLKEKSYHYDDISEAEQTIRADQILNRLDITTSSKPSERPGIILGATLAFKLASSVGDTVKIITTEQRITPIGDVPRAKKLEVVGIFESGIAGYDETLAFVDYRLAQKLFQLPNQVTGLGVRIDDAVAASEVSQELQRTLPKYLLGNWADENKSIFQIMKLEKFVLFLALTLIVIVASFNIVSSLTMLVLEKSKEIAILKSLGARNNSIRIIFAIQGIVIGLFGTLFGVILGLAVCWVLMTFDIIEIPPGVYPQGNRVPLLIDWFYVGATALSAFVISILVTLYPSTRASQIKPVEALHYE